MENSKSIPEILNILKERVDINFKVKFQIIRGLSKAAVLAAKDSNMSEYDALEIMLRIYFGITRDYPDLHIMLIYKICGRGER